MLKNRKSWSKLDVIQKFLFIIQVASILRHVGEILDYESDEQLEELFEKTAWYFDEKNKLCGGAYEAFKHAVA